MREMSRRAAIVAAASAGLAWGGRAGAVIVPSSEGRYLAGAADLAAHGQGRFGMFLGTAVGPSHFLTAAHVGAAGTAFEFGGVSYPIDTSFGGGAGFVRADGADLALYKVVGTLPTYAKLVQATDEVGREYAVFGRGTARGAEVRVGGVLKGWAWGPQDGAISAGYGMISSAADAGPGVGQVLRFPLASSEGSALSDGDSGGGLFIYADDYVDRLVGINHSSESRFSLTGDPADPGFHAALFDVGGLWRASAASGSWSLTPDRTSDVPMLSQATRLYPHLDFVYAHVPWETVTYGKTQTLLNEHHVGAVQIGTGKRLTIGLGFTPASLRAGSIRGGALEVTTRATASIRPGGGPAAVCDIEALTIGVLAKLDLADASLVVRGTDATAPATLASVSKWIRTARSWSQPWLGEGLGSSVAAADTTGLSALGVLLNRDDAGEALYDTFMGRPVDRNSVLVRFTVVGDADLDGAVTAADYHRIDRGRALGLTGWANGDFDYSNTVPDVADYLLLDRAFLARQAATLGTSSGPAAAVPEPGPAGGLGAAGLLALAAHRRRRVR